MASRPGGQRSKSKPKGPRGDASTNSSRTMTYILRHGAASEGIPMDSAGFVPVDALLRHHKLRHLSVDDVRAIVRNCPKQRFELREADKRQAVAPSGATSIASPAVSIPAAAQQTALASATHACATGKDAFTTGTDPTERKPVNEEAAGAPAAAHGAAQSTDSASRASCFTGLCVRATQGHSLQNVEAEHLLTLLTPEAAAALPCVVHGTLASNLPAIQRSGLRRMGRQHVHFATALPGECDNAQAY